jgi:hypothetical protein
LALYPTHRDVPVAEYIYRHEAEFAAGFLADAGIPFRLQTDDAGGVEAFMSISRPARLWVRAGDVDRAREVLDIPVHAAPSPDRPPEPSPQPSPAPSHKPVDVAVTRDLFVPESGDEVIVSGLVEASRVSALPDAAGTVLSGQERLVAGTLSFIFLAAGVGIIPMELSAGLALANYVLSLVLGIAAVFGRSVAPVRLALRVLSGHVP